MVSQAKIRCIKTLVFPFGEKISMMFLSPCSHPCHHIYISQENWAFRSFERGLECLPTVWSTRTLSGPLTSTQCLPIIDYGSTPLLQCELDCDQPESTTESLTPFKIHNIHWLPQMVPLPIKAVSMPTAVLMPLSSKRYQELL